jgi:hypothetical protein
MIIFCILLSFFPILICLSTEEKINSSSNDEPCQVHDSYILCYDPTDAQSSTMRPEYNEFIKIINEMGKADYAHHAQGACSTANRRKLYLHSSNGTAIPLMIIAIQECGSVGNMIGFYYEAFAYANKMGLALGRACDIPSGHCAPS